MDNLKTIKLKGKNQVRTKCLKCKHINYFRWKIEVINKMVTMQVRKGFINAFCNNCNKMTIQKFVY